MVQTPHRVHQGSLFMVFKCISQRWSHLLSHFRHQGQLPVFINRQLVKSLNILDFLLLIDLQAGLSYSWLYRHAACMPRKMVVNLKKKHGEIRTLMEEV